METKYIIQGLNKVAPPIASAVPDLFLSIEIKKKKKKNYNTIKQLVLKDLSYKCFFLDFDIRREPNAVCLNVD